MSVLEFTPTVPLDTSPNGTVFGPTAADPFNFNAVSVSGGGNQIVETAANGSTIAIGGAGLAIGTTSGTITSIVETAAGGSTLVSWTGLSLSVAIIAADSDDSTSLPTAEYVLRGNDTLIGGPGNDKLYGYGGDDTLIGGGGIDTYGFLAGFGADLVTDTTGRGVIDISADTVPLTGAVVGPGGTDLILEFQDGSSIDIQNQLVGQGADHLVQEGHAGTIGFGTLTATAIASLTAT